MWWEIERSIRQDFSKHYNIDLLGAEFACSKRAVYESCETATATTPMKRIKELRLRYARGLLLYSSQNISEIAYEVGYSRVQELSRDYRNLFGKSPSQERAENDNF